MFKKAEPKQASLKVSMYGPPGAGKTFTTLLMAEGLAAHDGKRIAYVDTERGTDFYTQNVKERNVHPDAFDFDAIYTRSLAEILQAVKSLDPKDYGVVVLDSISHIWESAIDSYPGERVGKDKDKIPMHAWGAIKRPYKELISHLIGSPFHVFILGRQKNVFEDDGAGSVRSAGVAMRAEGETAYEPHICLRMEERKDSKDSTRSAVIMYVEKDRTGILAGRKFPNPDFSTIEPLLALLGDEQASAEDEDERRARDAELHEAQAEKERKKAAKSSELLSHFNAAIHAATELEALGAVGVDIGKRKRYLTAEHQEALRALYRAKSQTFLQAVEID